MRLAVLGLGSMGRAFAARALAGGHRVTVWNRSAGRAAGLVDAGAAEAADIAAAVRDVEVALVSVSDDAAARSVCGAALAALGDGAVLVNVSTVSPATARELAEAGPVLDAPVLGAPAAIERGEGRFLIGGPASAVAALDPLWADLGAGYVHCGAAGAGATLKLASNLLLITGVAALAEAVATARGQGIPDELLRTVFGDSAVVSPATRLRLDPVLAAEHPGWFAPPLARKDIRLAVELAREAGVRPLLGPATAELLTRVIDAGTDWPDFAAVIEGLK